MILLASFGAFLPILGFVGVLLLFLLLFFISRYKRCPSDKILVVYGRTSAGQSSKCYAGGAAFIWPVIQAYEYLDLKPIPIDVNLQDALSKQNIRVSVPSQFTVGVSNKPNLMVSAAERLLGLEKKEINNLAHDIIMGQMRLVIANMEIEELNSDRDKFVEEVYRHVGDELHKIGLELINVNVTDIHDESGYIRALGQEAAAKAINDAKVKVAKEVRTGSIGQAEAKQEERVKVASANSKAEIGEAEADAAATEGKNQSTIKISQSNALRDIEIAEAERRGTAAKLVASARAKQEAYIAEKEAELSRAEMEQAKRAADEVVEAEIERQKAVIAAQAEAEQRREIAKGDAEAVLLKYKAEAEGVLKVLEAQAEGFKKLVDAAGGDAQSAIGLLMVDKVTQIAEIQADAINNVKMDKVVVFDGGDGSNVSGFMKGLFGMLPPLNDFMNQSGLELPQFLAQQKNNGTPPKPAKKDDSKSPTVENGEIEEEK